MNLRKIVHTSSWIALPGYIIAGIFYPWLGIAAIACMAAPVVTAFVRGKRVWCAHYCPRGSLLDLFISSVNAPFRSVSFFRNRHVKWGFFAFMMAGFSTQLFFAVTGGGTAGAVFLRIVMITTIAAIGLGLLFGRRTWCAICPMGSLAGAAAKISVKKAAISVSDKPLPEAEKTA